MRSRLLVRKDVRPGRVQSQLSSTYFSGEREGGGGRERIRQEVRKDIRSGRVQSQLSSTYFSGEREGGGGRERIRL